MYDDITAQVQRELAQARDHIAVLELAHSTALALTERAETGTGVVPAEKMLRALDLDAARRALGMPSVSADNDHYDKGAGRA